MCVYIYEYLLKRMNTCAFISFLMEHMCVYISEYPHERLNTWASISFLMKIEQVLYACLTKGMRK